MIYPYHCIKCGQDIEIIKSMHDSSREEMCPVCEITVERVWTVPHIIGASTQDAEYNPALGCVTKNKKHRAEIAKRKGLVEIGNDYGSGESMSKKFEKDRAEMREQSWRDIDKKVLNNE